MTLFRNMQAFEILFLSLYPYLHVMSNRETHILPAGVQLISLPKVLDDRGSLCFAEGDYHLPFRIRRVFWIFDVPEGKTRGDHAHRTCAEVIFPLKGSLDIEVDDGNNRVKLVLDRPDRGILIPPNVWCRLENFEPGTICLVLASQPYHVEGYMHSYDEFIKAVKCK